MMSSKLKKCSFGNLTISIKQFYGAHMLYYNSKMNKKKIIISKVSVY